MDANSLFIRQPFNEQYTLTIEVDAMLVNAVMKSKTEIRYDFTIVSVDDHSFECRLVQLDIFVHESNNPLLREVADVTAAFNRMFTELQLKIDRNGQVIDVINMGLIRSKWEHSRKLMQTAMQQNKELAELISLNDAMFTNPEKIKMAIGANEFIQLYFGEVFGTTIPNSFFKQGANVFNTALLPWVTKVQYKKTESTANSSLTPIEVSSVPRVTLGSEYSKHAYKSFAEHLDLKSVSPALSINSNYLFESVSGRLLEANVYKEEIADDQRLYFKTWYNLLADHRVGVTSDDKRVESPVEENASRSRFRFFD